ncbi:pyrimidine 5'-nucleotidase [Amylibacter marinus]|uniref:Pyrimidine 5'-nucleotidase n=1 Tax=Amylibacter marinus TaxID=1475483 RepID=A0ABQ5VTK7_9RHOB|nr:pyrimidine 5'-nucleotidase [Amylibacter marinus]GLQ34563.1 pyrimidine 5'-nucleotidase [Amylibacter marinus]
MKTKFAHIDTWVFDLDHTLYSKEDCLFDQIEDLMVAYMKKALNIDETTANHLRKHYWQTYGTTLSGLMVEHNIAPEPFLAAVHDIDLGALSPDPALATAINALPGRKIIYTNGDKNHAVRVLAARGLSHCFEDIFGIEHAQYTPKPQRDAFEIIFQRAALSPQNAAMFEDDPRNLLVPHEMGLSTILVDQISTQPHIHYCTDQLTQFLHATQA